MKKDKIADFISRHDLSDQSIEAALLEMDFSMLAKAISAMDDTTSEWFYRNISYSSRKQLSRLLKSHSNLGEDEIREAQNYLLGVLRRHQGAKRKSDQGQARELAPLMISTTNKHEIFGCLVDLSQRCHNYGLQSLESTMNTIEDNYLENFILKKGLEYMLSGRDRDTTRTLLENLKKVMLEKIRDNLEMILQGIDHIQQGSSSKDLVKTLKSYL
ncbi:FliG C-terminal domain-containing protein [Fibrobacterota bacterium]